MISVRTRAVLLCGKAPASWLERVHSHGRIHKSKPTNVADLIGQLQASKLFLHAFTFNPPGAPTRIRVLLLPTVWAANAYTCFNHDATSNLYQ